jgi:hypothetical protein
MNWQRFVARVLHPYASNFSAIAAQVNPARRHFLICSTCGRNLDLKGIPADRLL